LLALLLGGGLVGQHALATPAQVLAFLPAEDEAAPVFCATLALVGVVITVEVEA
jgi:hypothetical protein